MPIANCIVTPQCKIVEHSIVDLWASQSGQSPEHMSVNITTSTHQYGNRYAVMATLVLPSLWSKPAVSALQVGLAKALAQAYELSLDDVHVVTNIVESGLVVEAGMEEHW